MVKRNRSTTKVKRVLYFIGYILIRAFGSRVFNYNTHGIYKFGREYYKVYYLRIDRTIPVKMTRKVKKS
jgi:hypothetical protein